MGHFRVWAGKGGSSQVSLLFERSSFTGKRRNVVGGTQKVPISRNPGGPQEVGKLLGRQRADEARLKRPHRYPGSCPCQPSTLPYGPRVLRPRLPLARPSGPWRPAILLEGLTTRRGGGTRKRPGSRQFQGNTSAAAHTSNAELPGKPPAVTSLPAPERKLRRGEA